MCQLLTHTITQTNSFTQKCNKTTKAADPGHDMLPSPHFIQLLYLYILFYFLGSPTGDSQSGPVGVNFTEHDFLLDRGCSQQIFHGCSKQESSEPGSGDRCSLEDSKIDRMKKKHTTTDNGPHLSFTGLQLSLCTPHPQQSFS